MRGLAIRSVVALLALCSGVGLCMAQSKSPNVDRAPARAASGPEPTRTGTDAARPKSGGGGGKTAGAAAVGALLGALVQEGRNQKLRDQLNALGQRIDQLDAENRQLREQLAAATRLADENRPLREQLDAAARQAAEAQAARQRLQAESARARAAQQEAAERLSAAQREHAVEVRQLKDALDAATLELAAATQQLRILRERGWQWIALAAAGALAVGVLAARALWPRKIDVPLSASVTLGPWSVRAHAPRERLPGFGVQARLTLVHSQVQPAQPPLLRPAA